MVEELLDDEEADDKIVHSHKYKSAATGMWVNDTVMQTSHIGGHTLTLQKK